MWNNSAKLMIIRVNAKWRRGLVIPVPVWVGDEFLEALTELAYVAEIVLKHIPIPKDQKGRKELIWIEAFSPSGIIETIQTMFNELIRYKGLKVIDVKAGEVQFSIRLK